MRTFIVANRLIKQIVADKRTIGLLLFAPIFVIYLLSVILTASSSTPRIDIISAPDAFVSDLRAQADVMLVTDEASALLRLKNGEIDAYVIFANSSPVIMVDGADPSETKLVLSAVNKALTQTMADTLSAQSIRGGGTAIAGNPEVNYLYGSEEMNAFDAMAPMMMGFFIFFFVFLIAGISFLRERISGTLERVLSTPLRRSEIVGGYFFGFGLFVTIQTFVIQAFMLYVLDVPMAGSFWLVLLINLILAGGSLTLGTLLSAFARNEFQLIQFIPIVIVPQILFSGIFNLAEAPGWVVVLSKIFPMTYGADALRNVMIRGYGFADVSQDVLILFGYMVVFLVLNILALKKYRRI